MDGVVFPSREPLLLTTTIIVHFLAWSDRRRWDASPSFTARWDGF
jgi:hypothetical protein